jgi:Tol biopolymer transport system component
MRPHDDELRLEEVDDQIDRYARAPRGGWASPTARLIQDLHSLHANEQADAQSVEEVWQRMVQRGVVPSSSNQRRDSFPPYQQSISQPPDWRVMSEPARRSPLVSRVTALVAAVVLVALVGGLAVGLVLVRHQNSGISPQATATPGWEAVVSPNPTIPTTALASTLAYIGSDGNVWTMKWPGGTPLQLTTAARGPNTYSGLTWSPDGSMLAFAKGLTPGATSASLIVLKPDGTLVTNVPMQTPFSYGFPLVWSPDSTMLAYRSFSSNPNYQPDGTFLGSLILVNAHSGKTVKTVTYEAGGSGCGGGGDLTDLNQELWTVYHLNYGLNAGDIFAWSPDQRSILVSEDCDQYGQAGQVDLSIGKVNYAVPTEGGYQPGGSLVVGLWKDGTLGLTDLAGNHVRVLASKEPFAEPPTYMTLVGHSVWSSDGKSIYYEHDDGLDQVGVDGSHPHQVVKGTALDSNDNATMILLPRPSPNGQFLLYLKVTGSNRVGNPVSGDPTPVATPTIPLTTRWYVAQADGTNPVALPQGVIDAVWN